MKQVKRFHHIPHTLLTSGPLIHRLVTRLSAGVGAICPVGHSQYANALSGVVDV